MASTYSPLSDFAGKAREPFLQMPALVGPRSPFLLNCKCARSGSGDFISLRCSSSGKEIRLPTSYLACLGWSSTESWCF